MNRGSIAHLCFGFPAAKHVGSSSHRGLAWVSSSAKKYRHDSEEDNSKTELNVPEILFLLEPFYTLDFQEPWASQENLKPIFDSSYISIDVELSNLKLYNTMVIGNTWWRIFLHYIFFFTFSLIPMKYELVWGRIKKVKHFSSGRNSKT